MCLEFRFTVVSISGEVGELSTILPVRCTSMSICKWSVVTSFRWTALTSHPTVGSAWGSEICICRIEAPV